MKKLLITLFLLTPLACLAQDLQVGPAVRRPTIDDVYNINVNEAGYLIRTPKVGPSTLIPIDSGQVKGWTAKFSAERARNLGLFKGINDNPPLASSSVPGLLATTDYGKLQFVPVRLADSLSLINGRFSSLNQTVGSLNNALGDKASLTQIQATNANVFSLSNAVANLPKYKGSENVTIDPVDYTIRVTAPGSVTLADVNQTPGYKGSTAYSLKFRTDTKGRILSVDSTQITPGAIGAPTLGSFNSLTGTVATKADNGTVVSALGTKVDNSLYAVNRSNDQTTVATKADNSTVLSGLTLRVLHVADVTNLTATGGSTVGGISTVSVIVRDKLQGGSFFYAPSGYTANGGTVFAASGGGFWVRQYSGPMTAAMFGATGDGSTDDTQSLQAAINAAFSANNPATFIANSPGRTSNTLFISHGYYRVTNELLVTGSGTIQMERATSYGGTRIIQLTTGKHLFHIRGDNDGTSSGVSFIGGILKQGASSSGADVALIYGGESAGDGNNNSTYIESVWFDTPENYAINLKRGDDFKAINCTFDVGAFNAIKLGSSTGTVSNAVIAGNTFYQIALNHITVVNVEGLLVANNRVYDNNGTSLNPIFINAQGGTVNGLTVMGNQVNNVAQFSLIPTAAQGVIISGNNVKNGKQLVGLTGGGVLYGAIILGNQIRSAGAATVPFISGAGCGFQGGVISGNSLFAGAPTSGTVAAISLTDSRVNTNQIITNSFLNFPTPYSINSPAANGLFDPNTFAGGVSAQSRMATSTTPDADAPFGGYNYTASIGGLTDPAGIFLGLNLRHENGAGTGTQWQGQLLKQLYGPNWYERSRYADTGPNGVIGWTTPKRVHTNRWFPVDTAMAPVNGRALIYQSGQWTSGVLSASSVSADASAFKVITGTTLQAQQASVDQALLGARSTGLISGGLISINANNTKFDVAAGVGQILNNLIPTNPTYTAVSFPASTSLTPLGEGQNYIYQTASGTVGQQSTPFTPSDYRTKIVLGRVAVASGVITSAQPMPVPVQNFVPEIRDLTDGLGNFIITGLRVLPNADLSVQLTAGKLYSYGANFYTSSLDPSTINIAAASPKTFGYLLRSGTSASSSLTAITPAVYDNAGTVTAVPGGGAFGVNNDDATNQRVYLFPSGNIRIQYGQTIYADLATAVAAAPSESFVVNPNVTSNGIMNGILIGVISIARNATSLTDATAVKFTPADRFGQIVGTGGGVSATYDGSETKVTATAPISITGTGTTANPYSLSLSYGLRENAQTGTTYTLQESDNGKLITLTNSAAITVTLAPGLSAGWNAVVEQNGAGAVTWTNGSGVTNRVFPASSTKTNGIGSRMAVSQTGNFYKINGQIIP